MPRKSKKKRNAKGDGTLRNRANGTFEYRINYTDAYGEKKRKSFYGQSDIICYEKAEMFLERIEKEKTGIDVDATIVSLVRKKCENDYKNNFVAEQGYARNIETISKIEKSPIGNIPIANLTEPQVELFLQSLVGYSNSQINKIYRLIKTAFNEAESKGITNKNLILSSNLRKPKSLIKDKKVSSFTMAEQQKFVDCLMNHKYERNSNNYTNQLLIALYTGMRMGEVNALKASDIDFEKGIIRVRSTISRGIDYRVFIKDGTKTPAGIRDIPIMKNLIPILKSAIEQQPENEYDLLFFDAKKSKVITTSQVNDFFKRFLRTYNIIPFHNEFKPLAEKRKEKIAYRKYTYYKKTADGTFEILGKEKPSDWDKNFKKYYFTDVVADRDYSVHMLRHTFATRSIEAGVSAVVLKTWLGHTDIHITLDTYADVFDSMHNISIERLDNYVNVSSVSRQLVS